MSLLIDQFDACLFDMDGLLLDTERMFLRALIELTDPMGISRSEAEAFFVTLVGTPSRVTVQRLKEFLPAGMDTDAFNTAWRGRHSENMKEGVPLKPYVLDMLKALQVRGIPMAVVTSTHGAPARHHLNAAGLMPFFQAVCAGDEVSANKPDPAPYLQGAGLLEVDASRCVAFEDSDLGTQAARAAGCTTFQIPDLRAVDQALPELGQQVVAHLGEAAHRLGLVDVLSSA